MNRLEQISQKVLHDVPGRKPGRIDIAEDRVVEGLDAAWREAAELAGQGAGWLCLSDRVVRCPAPVAPEPGVFPLDGEWVVEPGASVHLRHLGDGRWRVRRLVRDEDAGDGGGYLVTRRFVERGRDGFLEYEVEWRLAQDALGGRVYRPRVARFAGFAKGEG